jgi:V8-like Glu-specific endopeptidase
MAGCRCAHSRSETAALIRHPSLGIGRVVSAEAVFGDMESEQELVGTDERVIVADTKKVPYRWVCSLDSIFEDPDDRKRAFLWPSTGTLISEKHVLTCAHALLDDIKGSKGTTKRLRARKIRVIPGRQGLGRTEAEQAPFGSSDAAPSPHMPKQWKDFLDPAYDYGLIKLKTPLGRAPLGYWGSPANGRGTRIQPVATAGLRGKLVHTAGYPSDKCGHLPQTGSAPDWKTKPCPNRATTQWRTSGTVLGTQGANRVLYNLDTEHGQSGSPVWFEDAASGALNLIAVHTAHEDPGKSNRGVLLTEEVLREVKKWM